VQGDRELADQCKRIFNLNSLRAHHAAYFYENCPVIIIVSSRNFSDRFFSVMHFGDYSIHLVNFR
jgi:hypothetical protein